LKERKAPVARNARINQLARITNLSPKAYAPDLRIVAPRQFTHSGARQEFSARLLRNRAAETAIAIAPQISSAAEARSAREQLCRR
jgi:hypothetical protein